MLDLIRLPRTDNRIRLLTASDLGLPMTLADKSLLDGCFVQKQHDTDRIWCQCSRSVRSLMMSTVTAGMGFSHHPGTR